MQSDDIRLCQERKCLRMKVNLALPAAQSSFIMYHYEANSQLFRSGVNNVDCRFGQEHYIMKDNSLPFMAGTVKICMLKVI